MNRIIHSAQTAFLLAGSVLNLLSVEFKFGSQTFTLPDGFTLERAAGPDLVPRPIEMDFDEQGNLYVTDSSGSNKPVAEQVKERPHRVLRLQDSDGDGIFDKSTVFADKMMFPEGAMWHNGSLYVSAPPVIWKLTDSDNDGVADKREEWLDAKTLTGCANDLHGPYLGPDGWIYWSKGAFAEQNWEQAHGGNLKTRAAHIFRRRSEGGLLESVMTGGMDNPVGLAFTPEGERIFTTTFFQHPGGGKRDGLVHAIYGGVYGKFHDVIDSHKKTGDLMPVLTHLGAAAPAGLARYESDVFGKDYKNNLFAALFNMHKITRHALKPDGASYKTEDIDFLVCDSTDFHPTDVMEDADGSLLVVDTGGWYKLCCPTSQLYKPDVLGAIYRIRRANAPKIEDPRGHKIDWASISVSKTAELLGDSPPAVAKRAIHQLALKKAEAVKPLASILKNAAPTEAKRNAIWALTRINDSSASDAVRDALADKDPSVQHTAIHSISVRRDAKAESALIKLLKSNQPAVQRAAAEALGRLGNSSPIAPLLTAAAALPSSEGDQLPDRVREHSLIHALIELANPDATRHGVTSKNPLTRRAALIALDQMDNGNLKVEDVLPLLTSKDLVLKQTANWIVSHRKDWAPELIAHYKNRLQQSDLPPAEQSEIIRQLSSFASDSTTQDFLADFALHGRAHQLLALRAISSARPKKVSNKWEEALPQLLASSNNDLHTEAIKAATALYPKETPDEIRTALLALARNENNDTEIRLTALNALASPKLDDSLFTLAQANLAPDKPVRFHSLAATLLSKSKLSDDQLISLTSTIKEAGPLEIATLLPPFESSKNENVGRSLLDALKNSRSLPGLHADRIKALFSKYPESIQKDSHELVLLLNSDASQQAAHIEQLLAELKNGDVARGQTLFNSTKAACSTCHAIGYLGGNLGPDLTKIGQVRTERDLLEALVYPSASFVRSYEPMVVVTRNGDDFSGVLKKDAAEEVILGTGPDTEIRIARADITEMRPGKVSVMPQGLDQQLSKQELADLLAFLKATKW